MSTLPARDFAADLARRIGSGAVPPDEVRARVEAAFGANASARLVAPDSSDAVAAVLAACSSEGWPVVPLGAATWCQRASRNGDDAAAAAAHGDATADNATAEHDASARPPILLSTARLNRVTEHEPADLVIGVQAGLTLERLAGQLAAKQQWLPLDPPVAAAATTGAVAARADSGPLRAAHGTPRDMVLGIEVATGDGRLLRFGGRVVKNVAGYDGVRLLVGSRGSLGLITGLFLRVRGAPRADRTVAIACGSGMDGARRGADLALVIRDAAGCDALELISPAVASRIGADPDWTLLVRLMGGEAAVAEGSDRVRRVAAGTATGVGAAGRSITDAPPGVWDSLANLERHTTAALRLSGPAASLGDGLAAAVRCAGRADGLIAAHAADGVIRVWHKDSGGEPPAVAAADVSDSWTLRYEGRWNVSRGPDPSMRRGVAGDAISELSGRLRLVFDPGGILRPVESM